MEYMAMGSVRATEARYIKLGEAGEWAAKSIRDGTIALGYYEAPHNAGLRRDKEAISRAFPDRDRRTASRFANEVIQFYTEPVETLWITYSDDHLYWCNARPEVEYIGSDKIKHPHGSRLRRTVNGWRNTDIRGTAILKRDLPGALTAIARFQGTICRFSELDRLLKIINCESHPTLEAARMAYAQAAESLKPLIAELHPKDLELLVELVFAQSGYRRQSMTGGPQKTLDIALDLPITGETAFVQVKTKTNQAEFDGYVAEHNDGSFDRMFYVYHTAVAPLVNSQANIKLIGPDELCGEVLKAGLFDWVLRKAS
jgi:hypothetical protein